MFTSLWRRLRTKDRSSSQGKCLPKRRHSSFRPTLEVLEDRALPSSITYGVLPPPPGATTSAAFAPPHQPVAASGALSGLQPIHSPPAGTAANQLRITVVENTRESVIDLCPVFTRTSGLHAEDGMQLSLLGNTNPGLVKPELSEGALTLTYTRWRSGTATITVGATDADGSCVRENVIVTVLPLPSTKAA
jgi:hypothetical protein